METQPRNTDALMNLRGTTCKSFVIGKKEISFASSAIQSTTAEDLSRYKTFVVKNVDNKKVVYDMEIAAKSIRYVSEEPGGLTGLHLMDGTVIMIKGSTAGVESNVTSDNPSVPGEIVVFADTNGKVISKSGYSIASAATLPASIGPVTILEELEEVMRMYNEDETLDSKVPTMQAVMDYVGSIDSILEMRRNGTLAED